MIAIRDALRESLPESVHRAQLALRRAARMQAAGVIFIHIPKNAGVSVNQALHGRFMGHYTARDVARYCPRLWAELPSFALTRNPWARCLSAYRFATQRTRAPDAARIARPGRYRGREFESFGRFVRDWLPAEPLAHRDQVFRAQSGFVCDPGGCIMVDHLGRVEDMPGIAAWLHRTLGHPVRIGHANRSADSGRDYRQAYDDESAEIVARLYAEDIARFGYSF